MGAGADVKVGAGVADGLGVAGTAVATTTTPGCTPGVGVGVPHPETRTRVVKSKREVLNARTTDILFLRDADGLDQIAGRRRRVRVARADGKQHVHALDHFAEDGVLAI